MEWLMLVLQYVKDSLCSLTSDHLVLADRMLARGQPQTQTREFQNNKLHLLRQCNWLWLPDAFIRRMCQCPSMAPKPVQLTWSRTTYQKECFQCLRDKVGSNWTKSKRLFIEFVCEYVSAMLNWRGIAAMVLLNADMLESHPFQHTPQPTLHQKGKKASGSCFSEISYFCDVSLPSLGTDFRSFLD